MARSPRTLAHSSAAALVVAGLYACGGGDRAAQAAAPSVAPTETKSAVSVSLLDSGHFASTSADAVPLGCWPTQVASAGGWSSCNLQWLGRYPIPGLTVGARVVGNRLYVSNWTTGWHVFDISNAENPTLLGAVLVDGGTTSVVAAAVENEDPATNGSVAVLSRTTYQDALVLDIRNPANMTGVAVPGASSHTHTCLHDCTWSYGSNGVILDLRDPARPVLLPQKWTDLTGTGATHDVTEVRPGLVVSASDPAMVIDTTDSAAPKPLFALPRAAGSGALLGPAQAVRIGHNVIWPRRGDDRFFMGLSEASTTAAASCIRTKAARSTCTTRQAGRSRRPSRRCRSTRSSAAMATRAWPAGRR